MYLKWRRVKLVVKAKDAAIDDNGLRNPANRYCLICELVESYRNENKQPRQRTIVYVARIYEHHIKNIECRRTFWWRLELHLERIDISPEKKSKIRQQAESKVPKPTT